MIMLDPSQIWGSRNRAYSVWVRDPLRWASQQKSQALLQRVVVEQLSPQLSGNAGKKGRLGISDAVKTQFHSHTTHKTHFRSAPEHYQVWPLHDLSTYFVFFRSTFFVCFKKYFQNSFQVSLFTICFMKKSFCFVDLHKAHLIISIVMGKFADGFEKNLLKVVKIGFHCFKNQWKPEFMFSDLHLRKWTPPTAQLFGPLGTGW